MSITKSILQDELNLILPSSSNSSKYQMWFISIGATILVGTSLCKFFATCHIENYHNNSL